MPGKTIEVRAPFDGAPVGTVTTASAAEVEQALATAHTLFRNRRRALASAVSRKPCTRCRPGR